MISKVNVGIVLNRKGGVKTDCKGCAYVDSFFE